MKIIDQNLQLSALHYASSESKQQRVHETFLNGQLSTRETLTISTKQESLQQINLANTDQTRPTNLSHKPQNHAENLQRTEHFTPNSSEPNRAFKQPTWGQTPAQSNRLSTAFEDNIALPPQLIRMIESIEALMEQMTGKPYTLKVIGYQPEAEKSQDSGANNNNPKNLENLAFQTDKKLSENIIQPLSKGERWQTFSAYAEQEYSQFQASGSVTTANGQQIQFNLNSQMSRSFSTQTTLDISKGFVLKDPLAVNFGGTPATLTLDKYQFDLDADGQMDNISFVNPGSGFLALDQNKDGVINNGNELFGAMTGNGFNELSRYDIDQNGWIDENDAIFSQLQIWQKDSNGFDKLQGLLELNIGAISLQSIATPFSLKDSNNTPLGQVVTSGLFLQENGTAGSVQQIDLVI